MTLKRFIQEHRKDIDYHIHRQAPNVILNDKERRLWVLNDEHLYNWARRQGVKDL